MRDAMLSSLIVIAYACCVFGTLIFSYMDLRTNRIRAIWTMVVVSLFSIPGAVWIIHSPNRSSIAFGEGYTINPLISIFGMFLCVIFGIAAAYVFNSNDNFKWREFVRPFAISPIVLLPLLGSIPSSEINAVQIISILIMAFQNGFFWQRIFRDAQAGTSHD